MAVMEEWKDIEGYEGIYQVSSYGNVKSLARTYTICTGGVINKPDTLICGSVSLNGYRVVALCIASKCKSKTVHRLVAEAFIPNPENKRCINHKDGDKLNNHIHNLEWSTHAENNKHAYDNGLRVMPKGINHCNFGKKGGSQKVPKLIIDMYTGVFYEGVKEAAEVFGVCTKTINHWIVNESNKTNLRYA